MLLDERLGFGREDDGDVEVAETAIKTLVAEVASRDCERLATTDQPFLIGFSELTTAFVNKSVFDEGGSEVNLLLWSSGGLRIDEASTSQVGSWSDFANHLCWWCDGK